MLPSLPSQIELALMWAECDIRARQNRKLGIERIADDPQGISESVPRTFFVDSGNSLAASTNDGLEPRNAFATVAQAVGACVAARGDFIMVAPGHAESITSAGALTINKSGVTILGLGNGAMRPTFTFSTVVGASLLVTAAGVTIHNCLFVAGIDALTGPIGIQAADCVMSHCETRDVAGSFQSVDFIVTTAAADRFHLTDWVHRGDTAAGANEPLKIVGGDGIIVENFDIFGNFAVAAIQNVTTACTNLRIGGGYKQNYIQNSFDSATVVAVTLVSTSTGHVGPNINVRIGVDATSNTTNITEAFVGAAMQFFQPLNVCNLGGEVAMQTNITASTDA